MPTVAAPPPAFSEEDVKFYTAEILKCMQSFEYFLFTYVKTDVGPIPDWPYIREFARCIDKRQWLQWLKRRQEMATWLVAAAHRWFAWHGDTAIFSYGEDHSKDVGGARAVQVDQLLPEWMQLKPRGMQPIRWTRSRHTTTPMPATKVGGVGTTLKFASLDEFPLHPHGADNIKELTPALTNSADSMLLKFGTAIATQGPAGPWYEDWKDIILQDIPPSQKTGNFEIWEPSSHSRYARMFTGRWSRPDQQGEEWWAREKASYPAGTSDEELGALYPESVAGAFLGKKGRVYPDFDANRHMKRPAVAWKDCLYRFIAEDPSGPSGGKLDPTGIVCVGVYKKPHASDEAIVGSDLHFHVYQSVYVREPISAFDIHEMLSHWASFSRLHGFVRPDDGGPETRHTLERMGWGGITVAGIRDPQMRRQEISRLLADGSLTISPELTNLRTEFETLRWADVNPLGVRSASGMMRIIAGSDHHGDLVDALGYCILAMMRGQPSPGRLAPSAAHSSGVSRLRASDLQRPKKVRTELPGRRRAS